MKGISRIIVAILFGLAGLGCIGTGLYIGFVQSAKISRNVADIKKLPELDAAAFQQSAAGKTVALTGILVGPNGELQSTGLVIYERNKWSVTQRTRRSSSGSSRRTEYEGTWIYQGNKMVNCALSLGGTNIPLEANNQVQIDSALHKANEYVPASGESADGIIEGTIRQSGFQAGDKVTIIGVKTATGVRPGQIYGGDRKGYISYLEDQTVQSRIAGIVMVVMGTITLIAVGLLIFH